MSQVRCMAQRMVKRNIYEVLVENPEKTVLKIYAQIGK
jgi:hypothetical protein